ncbi:MAG: hypothetical protein LBT05_04930 [Planctomycetaceae bacterium]|jgi:hypothetical protein|nr:hypothetical protein [Planctomycetaceae bacterium]
MIRRAILFTVCSVLVASIFAVAEVQAADPQQAFGRQWGKNYNPQDWNRFYHYPYVYYPHSYYPQEYFRSDVDPHNRYPTEMQVPAQYNRNWVNFYTYPQRYHTGKHFILDIF